MKRINPFITHGYVSPHYSCDRIAETEQLTALITNENLVDSLHCEAQSHSA